MNTSLPWLYDWNLEGSEEGYHLPPGRPLRPDNLDHSPCCLAIIMTEIKQAGIGEGAWSGRGEVEMTSQSQ